MRQILGLDPGVVTGWTRCTLQLGICGVMKTGNLTTEKLSDIEAYIHCLGPDDYIVLEEFQLRTDSRDRNVVQTIENQGVLKYLAQKSQAKLILQQPSDKEFMKRRRPDVWGLLRAQLTGKHAKDHWGDAVLHVFKYALVTHGCKEFKL